MLCLSFRCPAELCSQVPHPHWPVGIWFWGSWRQRLPHTSWRWCLRQGAVPRRSLLGQRDKTHWRISPQDAHWPNACGKLQHCCEICARENFANVFSFGFSTLNIIVAWLYFLYPDLAETVQKRRYPWASDVHCSSLQNERQTRHTLHHWTLN